MGRLFKIQKQINPVTEEEEETHDSDDSADEIIYLSQNNDFIKNLKYCNFKIRMINTDFKLYCDSNLSIGFGLKRKETKI